MQIIKLVKKSTSVNVYTKIFLITHRYLYIFYRDLISKIINILLTIILLLLINILIALLQNTPTAYIKFDMGKNLTVIALPRILTEKNQKTVDRVLARM